MITRDDTALRAQAERLAQFIAADPDNHALRCDAVAAQLAAAELDRAGQLIEAGLVQRPLDAQLRALAGQLLLARQEWAAACAQFRALLSEQADVHLAYNLAYGCMRLGLYVEAREALQPWARSPACPAAALSLLLAALHHSGALSEALALAHERAADFARDADFLATYALLAFDEGDLTLARQLSADAAAGVSLTAVVVAGSLALEDGDGDGATRLFAQAVRLNPQDGRSWSGLGVAHLLGQQYEAAERYLEQAVALLPQHIGSWHALGWCRICAGKSDAAQLAFEAALALDRNFAESHGGLAVVAALAQRRAQAETACALALRLDPQSFAARYAQLLLSGEALDPQLLRRGALHMLRHNKAPVAQRLRTLLEQA